MELVNETPVTFPAIATAQNIVPSPRPAPRKRKHATLLAASVMKNILQ